MFGTGFMGKVHTEAIRRLGNVEVVAVSGVDQPNADKFSAAFGIPRGAGWEELLADKEIDAVHICTPKYLHYGMAKASLQAGKNVLCDKPPATTQAGGVHHPSMFGGSANNDSGGEPSSRDIGLTARASGGYGNDRCADCPGRADKPILSEDAHGGHDWTHLDGVLKFIKSPLDGIREMHRDCGGPWTMAYLLFLAGTAFIVLWSFKSFILQVLAMILAMLFWSALLGHQRKRIFVSHGVEDYELGARNPLLTARIAR